MNNTMLQKNTSDDDYMRHLEEVYSMVCEEFLHGHYIKPPVFRKKFDMTKIKLFYNRPDVHIKNIDPFSKTWDEIFDWCEKMGGHQGYVSMLVFMICTKLVNQHVQGECVTWFYNYVIHEISERERRIRIMNKYFMEQYSMNVRYRTSMYKKRSIAFFRMIYNNSNRFGDIDELTNIDHLARSIKMIVPALKKVGLEHIRVRIRAVIEF